jgi:hypothetical protein
MQLTNQQVEDAIAALEHFNPPVHLRAKLRLNRSLRKLIQARQDKEHDRIRLSYGVVKDKTRKTEPGGAVVLTAEEAAEAQDLYKGLMREKVEVELYPLEVYDSEAGQKPADPELAVDASKIALDNRILSALLDVVLVETGTLD